MHVTKVDLAAVKADGPDWVTFYRRAGRARHRLQNIFHDGGKRGGFGWTTVNEKSGAT